MMKIIKKLKLLLLIFISGNFIIGQLVADKLTKKELYFVTSNKNKFKSAKKFLCNITKLINIDIDLDEIQSIDVKKVIEKKLDHAYKIVQKPVICEDAGLYILGEFNKFPGALIKFYQKCLGIEGIAKHNGGSKCYAECIIGFYDGKKKLYFVGQMNGIISKKPKGAKGYGWDKIFIPKGFNPQNISTYAEMNKKTENQHSVKKIAFKKLAKFLANNYYS